jgi:hypothetical protein
MQTKFVYSSHHSLTIKETQFLLLLNHPFGLWNGSSSALDDQDLTHRIIPSSHLVCNCGFSSETVMFGF